MKKAESSGPALLCFNFDVCYFLYFLLNPARPIKPEPKRSMVAGSGTTVTDPLRKIGEPTGAPVGGKVPGPGLPMVNSDPGTAPGAKMLVVPTPLAVNKRLNTENRFVLIS